ncbi:MAG TPA: Lrp/AsnC family transcriptional regulator [Thermoplasmata archaeon]|jgi:Lrp/AsnC family transcriptional regulator, leucine-responsive regulatory protein|nr:MAG TPA: Lrp/AsnC family transcriptional regulator [Thermoplasmata archaeon]
MAKNSKEQIQVDEMKILVELQKNAKENIDTIAKHYGFSRQKVWKIIKKLEESRMIWGYTAIIDEQKQDLEKYIMSFKTMMQRLDKKAAEEINLDSILEDYTYLGIKIESSYKIHGQYDWIIIFTAKDLVHAKKFVNLLMEKYPGVFEKVELSQILYSPRNHYIINPGSLKAKNIL